MPWVQKYTDNFNRANQPLNIPPWSGSGLWGSCKILNNVATGSASPQINMSYHTGALLADQYVEADLSSLGAIFTYVGVVLRSPGGTDRGYMFVWAPFTSQLSIIRFSFPALAALDGGPSTWPNPTGGAGSGRIRAEAQGQLLSLYWNGILIGSQTDTFYADGGAGIIDATQSDLWGIDNWESGEFPGGGGKKNRRHRGGELWGIIPEIANYVG